MPLCKSSCSGVLMKNAQLPLLKSIGDVVLIDCYLLAVFQDVITDIVSNWCDLHRSLKSENAHASCAGYLD